MSLFLESLEAAWCPEDLQPEADISFTLIKQTGEGENFKKGECERGGGVSHPACQSC